ncbi:hypothetical protein BU596_12370 [Staphylococcus arlettae]|uniref:hypothetical protein n=1 Tax=Staphylococcus arlettae TaxID=29378 RepID=UPI000D199856|nr:hypothetical protein [Staphylococcus arlettae]PTH38767.1 hypothetical protein BU596_12370 [Staphylococcus arlettae]
MKSNSAISKVLLASISTATLLTVTSPVINAQGENSTQNKTQGTQQSQEQENIKEVTTYKEFKNADGAVSINPANLSDKELEELGLNPQQTKQEFGISENGVQAEATKKWSKKISKGQLAGASATIGGVITVIGGLLSGGTVSTVSGGAFSIISGVITSSKHNGVQVGGTATKRLVRENPYQLPKKKWVYKITWAKAY